MFQSCPTSRRHIKDTWEKCFFSSACESLVVLSGELEAVNREAIHVTLHVKEIIDLQMRKQSCWSYMKQTYFTFSAVARGIYLAFSGLPEPEPLNWHLNICSVIYLSCRSADLCTACKPVSLQMHHECAQIHTDKPHWPMLIQNKFSLRWINLNPALQTVKSYIIICLFRLIKTVWNFIWCLDIKWDH